MPHKHGFVNSLRERRPLRNRTVALILITLIGYAILLWQQALNPYLSWLAVWSLAAFFLYGIDKWLAKKRLNRVPEAVLHLFALLGGVGGALIGIFLFRHKSNWRRHPAFPIWLLISLLLHLYLYFNWLS